MDTITEAEQRDFRKLLIAIYGDIAKDWPINRRILELLDTLIRDSEICSRYMHNVPRPFYFGDPAKWAKREFRDAFLRHLLNGGEHYLICLRGTGIKMKTEFILAARGL